MENTPQTQQEAILFIKYFGDGNANPFLEKPRRKRTSYRKLELLYHFHIVAKNITKGYWTDIRTMKETIADQSGISRSTITNIINSADFQCLIRVKKGGRKKDGTHECNKYYFNKHVDTAMAFLERKGFFKGMRDNRQRWRRGFDKRFDFWLLPLLEKGLSLEQIFKGELSIRSKLSTAKLAVVSTPKLADKTLRSSLKTQRHLDNPVAEPIVQFTLLYGKMKDRLQIPDWQIRGFVGNNALTILSGAVDEAIRWTNGNWEPKRMPALLQDRINEQRRRRNL